MRELTLQEVIDELEPDGDDIEEMDLEELIEKWEGEL